MSRITKEQYEYARGRVEDLLPLVGESDVNQKEAKELSLMSDIVIEYEKEYYPVEYASR